MNRRERRALKLQEKLHRLMIGEIAKRRLEKLHTKQLSHRDPLKGMAKCPTTLKDLFWGQFVREQMLKKWETTHSYCYQQGLQYKLKSTTIHGTVM